MSEQKRKKYSVRTLYVEGDYLLRRSQFNDVLYLYVYKRAILRTNLILSVKVIAYE